jgi:hypothetical protein
MSRHLSEDLTADLAAELQGPAPAVPPAPPRRGTPALSVVLTPLRWSWPSLTRLDGALSLRVGPWRAELTARL